MRLAGDAPDTAALWNGTAESYRSIHPSGFVGSAIHDLFPTGMVGIGMLDGPFTEAPRSHALLWIGEDMIDLHPLNVYASTATESDGTTQLGLFRASATSEWKACMWTGTAESFVNLHTFLPSEYLFSKATAVSGKQIFGYAMKETRSGIMTNYAVVWKLP